MAARAMKNCGITRLKIVAPENYQQKQALMMACGAKDLVNNAHFFDTLPKALADESCSVAFSRRMTMERAPFYSLEEVVPTICKRSSAANCALVFGSEADGLTCEELYQCDYRVYIPTSESFGSMNLAQAVLIACYEFFRASKEYKVEENEFFADQKTIKPMLIDFTKLLVEIGYNYPGDAKLRKKIVQAFKEICGRAGLRPKDVNMFLGIWGQVRKAIGKK